MSDALNIAIPSPNAWKARIADVAVIVPTFKEADNVVLLIEKLRQALDGIAWEVVFVDDDSPDGTIDVLAKVARTDARVRFLQRLGRRGLSSAVIEGILSTSAPYVAVIDADMQHDERLLSKMYAILSRNSVDLVVGSRYTADGGVGSWNKTRYRISRFATMLSRLVTKTELADPMSGFFMLRRSKFDEAVRHLSAQGYKILLDIVASSSSKLQVVELPYVFRQREHGESKLDTLVSLEFLTLVLDKLIGRWVPVRLFMFATVGALGVVVHMGTLGLLLRIGQLPFISAQAVATLTAMTANFFLNNIFTYRDKRIRGIGAMTRALLSFYAVCSVGALANVGVANTFFTSHYSWWLSALAGIIVGLGWNYSATALFTWRNR